MAAALLATTGLLLGCSEGPTRIAASPARYRCALQTAAQTIERPARIEVADLDGDGIDEEIKYAVATGGASYLHIARVSEGRHYALFTKNFFNLAGLAGVCDATGDGTSEFVWWEQSDPESVRAVVSRVRVRGGAAGDTTLHEIRFGIAGERLPNGEWAGRLHLREAFDTDGDGARDVIVLAATAGAWGRPRGLWFWDLREGTFSARVPTGATASTESRRADLDGDGVDELIIGLESPGNGIEAGEWDDLHSYVVAHERDGTVIWWNELGGMSSLVDIAICDMDADGGLDVATAVGGHSETQSEAFGLFVWRGSDGALLADRRFGCPMSGVVSARVDGETKLFTGSTDRLVRRLGWTGDGLQVELELDCGDAVECVQLIRFGPAAEGDQLVASTVKGDVVVLGTDLEPIAFMQTGETVGGRRRALRPTSLPVDGAAEPGLLALTYQSVWRLRLVRRPLPFWAKVALPVVGLLAVLYAVPTTRRGAAAWLRRSLTPRATRSEAVDKLLSSLATASHGKLAVTSTLRRLREQMRMLQSFEGSPPEPFKARFDQTLSDVRDIALPRIREISAEAERVGLSPSDARALRDSAGKLSALVVRAPRGLPSRSGAEAMGRRLDASLSAVESSLIAIIRAAHLEHSCDAGMEIDRALSAMRADAEGVEVRVEGMEFLSGARVCVTASELCFVVENLLGNAVDAVRDRETRRVLVAVSREQGFVVVTFADTGKGIREEEGERIFEPGVSDKSAGRGHGLAMSKQILARRGGSLRLVESTPEKGSVFELRLAVCP